MDSAAPADTVLSFDMEQELGMHEGDTDLVTGIRKHWRLFSQLRVFSEEGGRDPPLQSWLVGVQKEQGRIFSWLEQCYEAGYWGCQASLIGILLILPKVTGTMARGLGESGHKCYRQ